MPDPVPLPGRATWFSRVGRAGVCHHHPHGHGFGRVSRRHGIDSITLALSWMALRPRVGIGIVAVGALIAYLAFRFGRRKAQALEIASV